MPPIQSNIECTVVISKFESFHKFYVQKVEDDEYSSARKKPKHRSTSAAVDESKDLIQLPPVGSIIETLTDKADGVWYKAEVMATDDSSNTIIVRVLNDGSICKSTKIKYLPDSGEKSVYLCCLEEESEEDDLTNDPFFFNIISNIMTSRKWTLRTTSVREPYKVTLSINGVGCIDVICKSLPPPDDGDTANNTLSPSVDGPKNNDALIVEENPKNDTAKKNGPENNDALIIKEIPKNKKSKKNGHENNDALIIKEIPKNKKSKKNGPKNNNALIIKENPKNNMSKKNGPKNNDELITKENPKNDMSKKNGTKNNNALIVKENPKNDMSKTNGPKNNDALIIEENPKNDMSKKNAPKNNDALIVKENPKNDMSKKNAPKNNDALIIEENPKNDMSKKNAPKNNDALKIEENPQIYPAMKNGPENDLVELQYETVSIRGFETIKHFQAKSESLSTLYMERINTELKMCYTKKRLAKKNRVGTVMVAFSNSLGNCYRVLIESITSHGINCYLLDYGEYDVFRELYNPTEFLRTCPPLVRRCSLYAPKLAGKEGEIWYHDVDEMFKDIATIDGIKFNMIIKEQRRLLDPCIVSLMLENVDISEMLYPVNVRVTHVHSLTDFKVKAASDEQRAVAELLSSRHVRKIIVENPVQGGLYMAELNSKLARVRFDSLGGVKYVVNDIDDTLDNLSVDALYEIPWSIRNIPPSTMACSLILDDGEDAYSLNVFKRLAEKVVFVMSIINENDDARPNLVKLYYAHKDVLSILKLQLNKLK